jgi:hypothetical protein
MAARFGREDSDVSVRRRPNDSGTTCALIPCSFDNSPLSAAARRRSRARFADAPSSHDGREVVMAHHALLTRLRAEYLEMPGLRLTLDQAQRLCGVERAVCQMALDALVDERFLYVKPGGRYARLTEGALPQRAHPARSDLHERLRLPRVS